MRLLAEFGCDDIAKVYVLGLRGDDARYAVEVTESVQPPIPRRKKWVVIVSTLFGCPVGCPMCDAGGAYRGKLTADEMLAQIHFVVRRRFASNTVPVEKFKIQFARMGEPAFNPAVISVLQRLPQELNAPGLIPSVSTVAPRGCERFFDRLLEVKERLYAGGRFQLQFSIHTTDEALRERLIPVRKWSFAEIGAFGRRWWRKGDRKITLNFAAEKNSPIAPDILLKHFDPEIFLIKLTPLNPTESVQKNRLVSLVDPQRPESASPLVSRLSEAGYDVILSIGETAENKIGSNCGQYITIWRREGCRIRDYAKQQSPHPL